MGNRATIHVMIPDGAEVMLYTHWAGWPGGVLPAVVRATQECEAAEADGAHRKTRQVRWLAAFSEHIEAEVTDDRHGDDENRYTVHLPHAPERPTVTWSERVPHTRDQWRVRLDAADIETVRATAVARLLESLAAVEGRDGKIARRWTEGMRERLDAIAQRP